MVAVLLLADGGEFDSQYGHNDGYSLADALWTCSNMFAKAYVVLTVVVVILHVRKLYRCFP